MGRSMKKGPYIDDRVMKKVENVNGGGKKIQIKTWSRSCTIPPEFVGQTFYVHNGKNFVNVFIVESMVGHKLGEFAPTRTYRGHADKKKK